MPRDNDTGSTQRTYLLVVVVAVAVGLVFALRAPERGSPDVSVSAPVATTTTVPASTTTKATTTTTTTRSPTTTTKPTRASTTTVTPTTTTKAPRGTTTTAAPTTTTVDPGALPQTDAHPVGSGPTFDAGVRAMWQAIVKDDPTAGQPFFFPRAAYLQVKAISDPVGDYQNRLLANYADDIHTLHAQLGADAGRAQLAGVDVPDSQAVWVTPGQEFNQLPYWRVYGTKLRYIFDGVERSLPVTSLISWRGEWYVVHLGAIR